MADVVHEFARFIDHTLLHPDASEAQIRQLCSDAGLYRFATVCVNPLWVRLCRRLLQGANVGVCAAAAFPLGASTTDVKTYEARRAIFDGACEIDMVINLGMLKSGHYGYVRDDIAEVARAVHESAAQLKVIIEAVLLTDDEKIRACLLAKEGGADFVKTSTGFGSAGATVQDVALMRRAVGDQMGVKAAGGIRDFATARQMVAAGANRIGTSSGVKIIREALGTTD